MGGIGSRDDLYGVDWDFLALDRDGQIALISSTGYGQIPPRVLDQAALVEDAVERSSALPVIGEPINRVPDRTGDYSSWFERSVRGFYTYDWSVYHGPYRALSAPTVALEVSAADPMIAQAASLLELQFSFATTAQFWLDGTDR